MGEIIIQLYIIGFLFYCLYGLLPQNFNKNKEIVINLKNNEKNNTDMITLISIIIDALLWPITIIIVLLFFNKKH